MRRRYVLTAALAAACMLACGGQPAQQAQNTEPAPAATTPAEPPAATPQQPPAATPQQPPASQPPAQQPQPAAPRLQAPAAPAPAAPAKPKVHMVEVPAGTVLTLALDTGVNTKKNVVGDAFTATVVEAIEVDGREVVPAGALVHGKVTEAVPAKRGAGNAKLGLSFDELSLPGGYKTGIRGTFQEISESKKKRNAAIIGGSAAGGALLGRILGKDTKSTVIGTIVGGGIGTAVVMGKEGEQARLPADTPFEIKLEESVQVPHEPPRT